MRRRDFLGVLGGAAAWPLAARGQQRAMAVVGFLSAQSPEASVGYLAAMRRGLAESGVVEGQNVAIEYRFARGQYDRLPAMAVELARRPVEVLVAVGGDMTASAAIPATKTIPIVATFASDPVGGGFVISLNRPGGNVTGISNLSPTLEAKRLGLLRELMPQATTVGVLANPNNPAAANQRRDIETAARAIGQQVQFFPVSTGSEIEAVFASIAQARILVLLVVADALFTSSRDRLAALAARHAVPAMYSFRDFAVAGGLMSYGIDLVESYRLIGVYAGRILKGAKAADLPVLQPTKFEFVLNLKTAKTLGVKISDNLLSVADEVIE
jgi:putative ABC transport system substrate-binding protein